MTRRFRYSIPWGLHLFSLGGPLLVIFLFSGCATVGRDFPSHRITDLRLGETTKSELLTQFGRPYRRGVEDGDSTWTYVHYKINLFGGQTSTRDLYIRFEGNRVRSYTYNADKP